MWARGIDCGGTDGFHGDDVVVDWTGVRPSKIGDRAAVGKGEGEEYRKKCVLDCIRESSVFRYPYVENAPAGWVEKIKKGIRVVMNTTLEYRKGTESSSIGMGGLSEREIAEVSSELC